MIAWFIGLPSSGKTTLARAVRAALRANGEECCLLDGDEIRECLHPPMAYDQKSRTDLYATLAALAGLLSQQGLTVLVAATAHRRSHRSTARAVAAGCFLEVFVDTPPEICEQRDTKRLWRRARSGEIVNFPGVHEAFETPRGPALRISSADFDVEAKRVVEAMRT